MNTKMLKVTLSKYQSEYDQKFVILQGLLEKPTSDNINHDIKKSLLDAKHWRIIKYDAIPTDREFRNAWVDNGKKIVHNMDLVRNIHTDKLRLERKKILQELDIEWMRAIAIQDYDTSIKVEMRRQKLRDFPIDIQDKLKKAKTVDAVKLINPLQGI